MAGGSSVGVKANYSSTCFGGRHSGSGLSTWPCTQRPYRRSKKQTRAVIGSSLQDGIRSLCFKKLSEKRASQIQRRNPSPRKSQRLKPPRSARSQRSPRQARRRGIEPSLVVTEGTGGNTENRFKNVSWIKFCHSKGRKTFSIG